jgi:hypothetical protein
MQVLVMSGLVAPQFGVVHIHRASRRAERVQVSRFIGAWFQRLRFPAGHGVA